MLGAVTRGPADAHRIENDTTVSAEGLCLSSETLSMGAIVIARYTRHHTGRTVCRTLVPKTPSAAATSRVILVDQSQRYGLARSTSTLSVSHDVVRMSGRGIKETFDPVIRTASPAPLAQDFARQQVSKQQRSNFHSSSISPLLANMAPPAVNKTNLHPSGLKYVPSPPQVN
jgi:phosphoenolpyruvate carboxykinase (ATP)